MPLVDTNKAPLHSIAPRSVLSCLPPDTRKHMMNYCHYPSMRHSQNLSLLVRQVWQHFAVTVLFSFRVIPLPLLSGYVPRTELEENNRLRLSENSSVVECYYQGSSVSVIRSKLFRPSSLHPGSRYRSSFISTLTT